MNNRPLSDTKCTGVLSDPTISVVADNNSPKTLSPQIPKKIKKGAYISGRRAHLYTSCSASFTIEAALVLPVFLFLMLTVLYLFEAALLQMQIRDALYDLAILKARAAYLTQEDEDTDESLVSSLLSDGVQTAAASLSLQGAVDDDLGELIVGGISGIICEEDEENSSDTVTALTAKCTVKLPVSVFGSFFFTIAEEVSVRNWVGYDPSGSENSDMVYVTANGTVYHEDRNCTYLNLSVKAVSASELSSKRNSSGHIYYACEYCGNEASSGGIYYITTYGETYHTSLTCSGLKRTVYLVSRDETDLPACSKCGGS